MRALLFRVIFYRANNGRHSQQASFNSFAPPTPRLRVHRPRAIASDNGGERQQRLRFRAALNARCAPGADVLNFLLCINMPHVCSRERTSERAGELWRASEYRASEFCFCSREDPCGRRQLCISDNAIPRTHHTCTRDVCITPGHVTDKDECGLPRGAQHTTCPIREGRSSRENAQREKRFGATSNRTRSA